MLNEYLELPVQDRVGERGDRARSVQPGKSKPDSGLDPKRDGSIMEGFKSGVKSTLLAAVLLCGRRTSGRPEWKQEISRYNTTYDASKV